MSKNIKIYKTIGEVAKILDLTNKKTGNNIFSKELPFTFFWSPIDSIMDKYTKWSNNEMQSSESFAKNFHNNTEILIKKIYELNNK